jgi:8-oxo-dGTP pyrophosphatase MutT (NUDIX family)
VSAGGVITRPEGGAFQVVLVGRARPLRWSIPKGTPLPGETLEQTAMREVREETGLSVRILERLGDISYSFSVRGVRHLKTVHFYLLNAVSGSIDEHDWENDYVAWVPEHDVPRLMSFESEFAIVQQAIVRTRERFQASQAAVVPTTLCDPQSARAVSS